MVAEVAGEAAQAVEQVTTEEATEAVLDLGLLGPPIVVEAEEEALRAPVAVWVARAS